jgi:hypothetical protein
MNDKPKQKNAANAIHIAHAIKRLKERDHISADIANKIANTTTPVKHSPILKKKGDNIL